jgi:signal transduction histidine kinase
LIAAVGLMIPAADKFPGKYRQPASQTSGFSDVEPNDPDAAGEEASEVRGIIPIISSAESPSVASTHWPKLGVLLLIFLLIYSLAMTGLFFKMKRQAAPEAENWTRGAEASVQEARQPAENADTSHTMLLSAVSHELKTPLNAVIGYAQLLETSPIDPEAQSYAAEIREAGLHMLEIIDDLLDWAAITSGVAPLDLTETPIVDLVEECLRWVEPEARKKEIAIIHDTSGASAGLAVHADRVRLRQILLNLLSNAVKYNRKQGSVRIHYEQDAAMTIVNVSDTGVGIEPGERELVFRLFYRIRKGNEQVPGSGIGLPLSLELAKRMGGTIRLKSRPGQGSSFSLVLPRGGQVRPADESLPI